MKTLLLSALLALAGLAHGQTNNFNILDGSPLNVSSVRFPLGSVLTEDAADALAQRRGVNAQAFRVYNTYTDASNYERAVFSWSANLLSVGPQAGGTGSLRIMSLLGSSVEVVNQTITMGNVSVLSRNGGSGDVTVSSNAGNIVLSRPLAFTNLLLSNTAPTISAGFGTSPSVTANNGTAAFRINVGTGGTATSGTIGLPTAATGWNCFATDFTTPATGHAIKQTGGTATTAILSNYNNAGTLTAWTASDILVVSCFAY
jgi:hypothetical protein